jgi:hypothetical protein
MATNTAGSQARQDPRQVSNTIRFEFNFSGSVGGIVQGVGKQIGVLPAGAYITLVQLEIVTAFNAGTTNPITVGSNASSWNNIMAAGDNTPGTPGVYAPALAATKFGRGVTGYVPGGSAGADTPIFLMYAPTGAAATTGVGVFLLEFEGGFPG